MNEPFSCVAVLGPGVLGGSIALGIRDRLPEVKCRIWARRESATENLLRLGFSRAELASGLGGVVDEADLVVLATPVGAMRALAQDLLDAGLGTREVVVTDVGSVKEDVEAGVGGILRGAGVPFVGSHPMAGSEKAGLEHARSDLFAGAHCIVTDSDPRDTARARVVSFWESLGATVSVMPAKEHDQTVARISHLPHAAAAAVVRAALEEESALSRYSGGGLRDTTRVAAGNPEMWSEILLENRNAVLASLRDLEGNLSDLLALLENRDKEGLVSYLRRAKALRESF